MLFVVIRHNNFAGNDVGFQFLRAFARRFGKPLPISADGQTATHNALGFDHKGRVDVAVNPNEPEGIWLRHYLEAKRVPAPALQNRAPSTTRRDASARRPRLARRRSGP